MISSTKLSVALKGDYLARLQQLGTTQQLPPRRNSF
jgi:hypothetical protein